MELVGGNVDLIIAGGTKAVEAAKKATTTIPIVMTNSGDPVGSGLVASLAKPGGNITGLTQISPDLSAKRIELLKEAFPSITSVGVVWNPGHSAAKLAFEELKAAGPTLGVEVHSLEVKDAASVDAAFQPSVLGNSGALIVVRDPVVVQQAQAIVDHAATAKLPALYETRNFIDAGGVLLFGPSFADLYRRSADYVGRILDGANPADLPIERPTTFEIVVNKKAAAAAGLTIPQSVLVRADDVIE
jgi:putative tryptophan/tyrosine transport system substrate-binding protein